MNIHCSHARIIIVPKAPFQPVTVNKIVHNTRPARPRLRPRPQRARPRPRSIFTLRAKLSGAVYCYRSCLCVCMFACLQRVGGRRVFVCLWVCYHDNSKLRAIDPHQTAFVGKGSDHLQLITFWPSSALGEEVCGGAKFF